MTDVELLTWLIDYFHAINVVLNHLKSPQSKSDYIIDRLRGIRDSLAKIDEQHCGRGNSHGPHFYNPASNDLPWHCGGTHKINLDGERL